MMRSLCLILIIPFLGSGVDSLSLKNSYKENLAMSQVAPDLSEPKVLEAVFRYQIGQCYKDLTRKRYFLSYKGVDPPTDLMARFEKDGSRVRMRSEMADFYKRSTGERGVLLTIEGIELRNTVADVQGACIFGMLDGSSYLYRVVKKGGRWKVTTQRRLGFS